MMAIRMVIKMPVKSLGDMILIDCVSCGLEDMFISLEVANDNHCARSARAACARRFCRQSNDRAAPTAAACVRRTNTASAAISTASAIASGCVGCGAA
jgi:hypothetical protein